MQWGRGGWVLAPSMSRRGKWKVHVAEEEVLQGYREIPEEDRLKAKIFFDRGKTVADTGNYEYAVEMFLQGLAIDPDLVEAHQTLREISLKRKASGGKSLGMFEAMKLKRPTKDDKQNLLAAEKLLGYEPGNTDYMQTILQNAHRAGFYDTVTWIGPILQRANADSKKPDFSKFIVLKDIYKTLKMWKEATEACAYAVRMRELDMDLQTELKNLGAQRTMDEGGYRAGKSFRDSVRDAKGQRRLMDQDRDILDQDVQGRLIADAETEFAAEPDEPGKLMKLVDALVKTELADRENRAIELLSAYYEKTKQFRFRYRLGQIKMIQLQRMERSLRALVNKNPTDPEAKKDYLQFRQEKAEEELKEYKLWSENYPTDRGLRFQVAVRHFELKQFTEAIPIFQEARNDPKWRIDAGVYLGRAFLEAGFDDEAVDTLKAVADEYQLKGDDRSKIIHYWLGRAMEQKGDTASALKEFSRVTQWDFNYLDVQARVKKLRSTE